MLEVAAAREVVLRHARRLTPVSGPLAPAPVGRVLADDVTADRDSPPFAKAVMDGYAVRAADVAGRTVELRVVAEVPAGAVADTPVGPGEAVALYTGSMLPPGADAVVRKEDAEPLPDGRVRLTAPHTAPGQFVLDRGREMTAGQVVLGAGSVLSPAAVGLLAAVGRTTASLYPAPRVAVLATGSELVDAADEPGPGQIRNSNGPMLAAQAERAGAAVTNLGIVRDDADRLRDVLRAALAAADVLVLAGGVSVGKYDLVPDALRAVGVEVRFHSVRVKPGKPLLFGTAGDVLVFGLPGNPVSSFVGFELFVRPALRALAGHTDPGPTTVPLPLADGFAADNNRPTYHPGKLEVGPAGWRVRPLDWFGSADLRGLAAADALLALPPGQRTYRAGEVVDVVMV